MINRLKELRARHNLTQEDLAAKVGVSRQADRRHREKEKYDPSLSLAFKLAKCFGTKIEDISRRITMRKTKEVAVAIVVVLSFVLMLGTALQASDVLASSFPARWPWLSSQWPGLPSGSGRTKSSTSGAPCAQLKAYPERVLRRRGADRHICSPSTAHCQPDQYSGRADHHLGRKRWRLPAFVFLLPGIIAGKRRIEQWREPRCFRVKIGNIFKEG